MPGVYTGVRGVGAALSTPLVRGRQPLRMSPIPASFGSVVRRIAVRPLPPGSAPLRGALPPDHQWTDAVV